MLLIDIGNTRIKCVARVDGALKPWPPLSTNGDRPYDALPAAILAGFQPERVLVSNVAGTKAAQRVSEFCQAQWAIAAEFASVSRECAGMTTHYREPHRLGVDRWLAALAAWHHHRAPVCAVDAGTALTIDFVTADGQHLGGMIAPGLELMRHALSAGTAQLESDAVVDVTGFADNTNDAISLGCSSAVGGLLRQARERIAEHVTEQDCRWLLTGGGAGALTRLIDWPFEHDPWLVHRGLLIAMGENS